MSRSHRNALSRSHTGGWKVRDIEIIRLAELLPSSIAADPDVLAVVEALDAELRQTTLDIRNVAIIKRLHTAWEAIQVNPSISDEELGKIISSELVDIKAWDWHVDFYDAEAPLSTRVKLVAKSLDWHTRKGTPSAVEEVVTAVFADGKVIEWWDFEEVIESGSQEFGFGEHGYGEGSYGGIGYGVGYEFGYGELGYGAYGYGGYGAYGDFIGGWYSGGPYWFRVETETSLENAEQVNALVEAIWSVKNTRSWLAGIYSIKKFQPKYYVGTFQYMLAEDEIGLRTNELGYGHGGYGGMNYNNTGYGRLGYGKGRYGGLNHDIFSGEFGYGGTLRWA